MTPDELLTGLRDIQLPDASLVSHTTSLSPLPYLLLVIALIAILVVRYTRNRCWLRQARRRLNDIQADDPSKVGEILALAAQIAAYRCVTPLPDAAFLPPQAIGPQEVKQLYQHLQNVLAQ